MTDMVQTAITDHLGRLRERARRFERLGMTGLAESLDALADELEDAVTAPRGGE